MAWVYYSISCPHFPFLGHYPLYRSKSEQVAYGCRIDMSWSCGSFCLEKAQGKDTAAPEILVESFDALYSLITYLVRYLEAFGHGERIHYKACKLLGQHTYIYHRRQGIRYHFRDPS